MRDTRFGPQPAYAIIKSKRITFAELVRKIGCSPSQFYRALDGSVRPADAIREKLPLLVGVELTDLFTARAIAKPARSEVGRYPKGVDRDA